MSPSHPVRTSIRTLSIAMSPSSPNNVTSLRTLSIDMSTIGTPMPGHGIGVAVEVMVNW